MTAPVLSLAEAPTPQPHAEPADYMAAQLGKVPTTRGSCPALAPCYCGLLRCVTSEGEASVCAECAAPAVAYANRGASPASPGRARRDAQSTLLAVLLTALALIVVAQSSCGTEEAARPRRVMEAQ